jgi:hypothetical protein
MPGDSPVSLSKGPEPETLNGVRIIYRNFSGLPLMFNLAGQRNFCIPLEEEQAKRMERVGWNVRWQKPRLEDEDKPRPIIKVNVKYETRDGRKTTPPKIVMLTSRGKTELDESMVGILDRADIVTADLIINPYPYTMQGRSGYSAYLKTMYVVIQEDELEIRYNDVDGEVSSSPVPAEGVPF